MNPWEFHPALVHFPIALLIAGVVVDLYAGRGGSASDAKTPTDAARVATGLLIAGIVTALLAAIAGLVAFFTVPGTHTERAHDQMPWHIGVAVAAVVLFLVVAIARWTGREAPPRLLFRALGVVAAVTLLVAAYLGGTMVYQGGMGIESKLMAPSLHKSSGSSHAPVADTGR